MPAKEKKICPHCKAKMVEYRHSLSKGLGAAVAVLADRGKPTVLTELNLTHSQYTNFYTLRYWGIAEQEKDQGITNGAWFVTPHGKAWLRNTMAVPRTVWSYRGEFLRYEEGPQVFMRDLVPGYRLREDYVRDALPHQQHPLFE